MAVGEERAIGKGPQLVAVPGSASLGGGALPDLADSADRDAVERTLDGDREAFAGIVRRHASGLVALCARVVGDRHHGEELAQEALARAYSSLGTWRRDGRFRHWLYRIATNGCRDYLKAGARAEQPSPFAGEDLVAPRDPERDVADRQLATALEAEVGRLPPAYREAFLLFHGEHMDYEQMRCITGVSVGALKVRVHRARRMLQEALSGLLAG